MELTDTSQSGPEASTVSQNIVSKRFRYFSPWLVLLTAAWCVIYFGMFPDPVGLAARNWPLVFVGVCGAVIGNITAIGGGLVFIPVLMFAYSTDPVSALKLTFVTQAVGMTSGATGWLSRGEVPVRLLKWTVPTLVLGALISSFLIRPNPMLVKGLFGPVTIIAGVLTLLTMHRRGGLPDLPPGANWPVAAMSLLGGLVTGWVAVGEGEIIAAFCMLVYHLSPNRALGLGVTLLAINSIFLALVHGIFLGGVPWNMALFTALGVLWGGRLGPFLAQWISTRMAKKIFAVVAILNGLLILFQVFGILGWLKKL